MKIGEFAKKYGIKASAVRYYIDKALITPKRVNGQYSFDATCVSQMDKIMQYKKYKFALEDIEILCYYENAAKMKDSDVNAKILQLLHKKKEALISEIEENNKIIEHIEEEIKCYEDRLTATTNEVSEGVPIEYLGMVCCPKCGAHLNMQKADINIHGIVSAELKCSCDYTAEIRNGMIISEGCSMDTPFKAFDNINSIKAINDDFSPAYRNLFDKAHLWMFQWISSHEYMAKSIMTGPFAYNFFLQYIEKLPEDCIYIITDVSVNKLLKLQKYFSGNKRKIIYIAGSVKSLPIKRGSVALYIDDYSNSNHIFTYNESIFQYISPLLTSKGKVIGQFVDYSMAPKSLENFKEDHISFAPELLKKHRVYESFKIAGLEITETNNCGSTHGREQDFARHVAGEPVSVISYCATKK